MKDNIWWNLFSDTGNPDAYLIYKKLRGDTEIGANKNDRSFDKVD